MTTQNRLLSFIAAFAVFAALLVVYSRTLMPGTVGGDAGELQYAAPLLALVHPTGQPLYVLLGYVWTSLLSLGTAAYEMNVLAAVSGAIGGGLLAWFVGRVYGYPLIGAVAGVVLGFGATIWGESVLADKYGFNVLLAALIVGLTLWWDRDYDQPHGDRLLYGLSIAFAIGLLHHRSLALFAVGIGLLVVVRLRADLWRKRRRTLMCAALVLLPPLLIYPTVLPWLESREMTPLLWQPTSAGDWLDFLLERHVISGEALVFDSGIGRQLAIYLETLLNDYTLVVPLIALVGVVLMLRRYPGAVLFLIVSFALQAVLSANFRGNVRQFTYYLPSFVVLMYAFAYGLIACWYWVRNTAHEVLSRMMARRYIPAGVALGALAVALIVPALQFAAAYPDARERAIYGDSLDIWRQTLKSGDMGARLTATMDDLPQDALVASDWEQVTILWYKQQVEGMRPDLEIVYPIERYAESVGERPVCMARHVPIDPALHPSNVGAFVCLDNSPRDDFPQDMTPIGTTLYDSEDRPVMALAGVIGDVAQVNAGTHVPLALVWEALAEMRDDYSLSLQVLDSDWNPVWSRDIQAPVMGLYATSQWSVGEIITDYHEMSIDRTLPPGTYRWSVVVYNIDINGTFIRLRDADDGVNILGGTFEVLPG